MKPAAERSSPAEERQPIGFSMYARQTNKHSELVVVTDKDDDSEYIRIVKKLIREATSVRPEDRPSTQVILQKLLLDRCVANETEELKSVYRSAVSIPLSDALQELSILKDDTADTSGIQCEQTQRSVDTPDSPEQEPKATEARMVSI